MQGGGSGAVTWLNFELGKGRPCARESPHWCERHCFLPCDLHLAEAAATSRTMTAAPTTHTHNLTH